MSYTVTLTDGTVLTTIADATVDNTSSLTLIGRNYPGYGQYIANDLVHILENFSNTTSPPNPLTGQFWYDSTTELMNIFNGTSWSPIAPNTQAPVSLDNPSAPSNDRLWQIVISNSGLLEFQALNDNLSVKNTVLSLDGTANLLIGSMSVGGALAGTLPNPTMASSVNLPGVPTATTASPGTNTTQIATTAFVESAVNTTVGGDLAGTLPNPTIKASVGLTGTPTAPTASPGTNTTQIATTAYVAANTLLILQASLNLYVATTGNDSNPGTISSPFLTLQYAWNYVVANINTNGYDITINVGNGTYTAGVICSTPLIGAGNISFIGNPGTPNDVFINVTNGPCFTSYQGASIQINGFTIAASGTATDFSDAGYGLVAEVGGAIYLNNIVFSTCSTAHMVTNAGGYIAVTPNATYTISGSAPEHMISFNGGTFGIVETTITLVGSPTFNYFANCFNCATMALYNNIYQGSGANGQKYVATLNGVIVTNGAGGSYLPGTVPGATALGGQYD